MEKLILLAGLVGALAMPALAARARNPRRALKRLLLGTLLFNLGYAMALRWLYPRFS